MAGIKKGTVYKNEWARVETYFVVCGEDNGIVNGIRFSKRNSGWEMKYINDYQSSWLKGVRFTVIGSFDIEGILLDNLNAVIKEYKSA